MGRRKEQVTVYFDPKTYAVLRALTGKSGVPTALYIREAVDEWLARRGGTHGEAANPGGQSDTWVVR
jgi:hypothetical protein